MGKGMRKLGISALVFLGACSTTRITYEVSDEPSKLVVEETKAPEPSPMPSLEATGVPDREPDVRSVPATVTFDYPERVNPALYEVTQEVNVRDFPGMEGNVIGTLKVGDKVVGNEIEGPWIRIYENSYTSLHFLKRVY
jgi:hypothetical protein